MGSVGTQRVGVGTGRLLGRQIADILEGRVTTNPPDFIDISNPDGSVGFTIDMSRADKAEREGFLRVWRGRSNTDNADRVYNRVYTQAINSGLSPAQATQLANDVRTQTTKQAMNKLLQSERGKQKFPNIRIS